MNKCFKPLTNVFKISQLQKEVFLTKFIPQIPNNCIAKKSLFCKNVNYGFSQQQQKDPNEALKQESK